MANNWRYEQDTGRLYYKGAFVGAGYAGHPPHVNDPDAQEMQSIGPLPRGTYTIGPPYKHPTKGPVVQNIDPEPDTEMFGRSLFRFHGESVKPPAGYASEGCIIMARPVREQIAAAVTAAVEEADSRLVVCLSTDP